MDLVFDYAWGEPQANEKFPEEFRRLLSCHIAVVVL
jgi:hypothetical protein